MAVVLSGHQNWRIKVLMVLVLLAFHHNSICLCSTLLHAALIPASHSLWRKLYDKGDSSSFLYVTGLTREAFNGLLYIVIPSGHSICRPSRGRPWSLPLDGMLVLLNCYLGSQMLLKCLCLNVGITPLPCSRILKMVLCMTVKPLRFHPLVRVEFPNKQKCRGLRV